MMKRSAIVGMLLVCGVASAEGRKARSHRSWMFDMGHGRLGVELMSMSQELRMFFGAPKDAGVLVNRVVEDSPAAKAGLRTGDVIVTVDGDEVEDTLDVLSAIGDKKAGDSVRIGIVRDKRTQDLAAKIEEDSRGLVMSDALKAYSSPWGHGEVEDTLKELRERLQQVEEKLEALRKKPK